ncbi:MAG: lactate utilization protein [Eubacteriales bacterium]|nr:lactate utilization protein [Eubacteriales bacterium]
MDIKRITAVFESRGFSVQYFETGAEAVDYLAQQTAGKSVSFGGSMTLEQLGAYEKLNKATDVSWHWKGDGYQQTPEVYITSANAVSETGEIVNIDGAGNRVSATLYGPKEVFFVCGINKLTPDLTSAIDRAQNIAAPKNAWRLFGDFASGAACMEEGASIPACAAAGGNQCYHCKAPNSICRAIVIHQGPMRAQERCELILIGEDLGY